MSTLKPPIAASRLATLSYAEPRRQMGKTPKASTLNNFAAAWNRLQQTAISRGWLSDKV